jgi:hypothetical protein
VHATLQNAFGIAEPKFGNPAYGDGVIENLIA